MNHSLMKMVARSAWVLPAALLLSAARLNAAETQPATAPAATLPAATAPALVVDLSTPRHALKTMLQAARRGDVAALRQCVICPTPQSKEAFELVVVPSVAEIGLTRAAVARFGQVPLDDLPDLTSIDVQAAEDLLKIDAMTLTQSGKHATLARVMPDAATTAPATPATPKPATAPATRPATSTTLPADEAADEIEESWHLVNLEQDAHGQWHVLAEDIIGPMPDPEELPSLRHAAPATLALYARLQEELAAGKIPTADAFNEKFQAAEALIMDQVLNAPDQPATLPSTLPTSRPMEKETPGLPPTTRPTTTQPSEPRRYGCDHR